MQKHKLTLFLPYASFIPAISNTYIVHFVFITVNRVYIYILYIYHWLLDNLSDENNPNDDDNNGNYNYNNDNKNHNNNNDKK